MKKADPDNRAYAFSIVGGVLLWLGAMAASGKREAWDSGLYCVVAYPLAILFAGWLGYEFPDRPWRWALAILENFQGEVPDVLRQYGAPDTIRPG